MCGVRGVLCVLCVVRCVRRVAFVWCVLLSCAVCWMLCAGVLGYALVCCMLGVVGVCCVGCAACCAMRVACWRADVLVGVLHPIKIKKVFGLRK